MPNMVADGLLIEAIYINKVALSPASGDLALQNAVQAAINTAALAGLLTITVNVSSYSNTLVQLLMKKLVDMGYTTSLSNVTLTVNWP